MDTSSFIEFIVANRALAPWLAGALAAAETIAFLSMFIPATALLMAVGAVVATDALPFAPIWIGASVGAVLGSTASYAFGRCFGAQLERMWPLSRYPHRLAQTQAAFVRWGLFAIFLGHFIGPLRPVVFLFAGMSGTRFAPFIAVNVIGAATWDFVIPKTGELGGDLIAWFWTYMQF